MVTEGRGVMGLKVGGVLMSGVTEKNGKNPGEEVKTQFALC